MKSTRSALITGASSGIGADFARLLAQRGYDLILVARRQERLEALSEELRRQFSISVDVLKADLSNAEDAHRVARRIESIDNLELLINNAGFGSSGKFAEIDLSKQIDMAFTHIVAPMILCRAALPGMLARNSGAIINVASVAAFAALPGSGAYSGSKAFLVSFTKSLALELEGSGVKVQALCPGFTYTEFHDTKEFEKFSRSRIPKWLWMTGEAVVLDSLNALERNKVVFIPAFRNRILAILARLPLSKLPKQARYKVLE